MEKEKFLEVGLDNITDFVTIRHDEHRFLTSGFGIVNSFLSLEPEFVRIKQPIRIKENRMIMIRQGAVRAQVNLIEQTFRKDMLFFLTPDSIVQLLEVSPGFDGKMLAVTDDFLPVTGKEQTLVPLFRKRQDFAIRLSPPMQTQIETYFDLLWRILRESPFRKGAVQHLLSSLLYDIGYMLDDGQYAAANPPTHQEDIFRRFIALVNTYSKRERNVSFYADKLCLTPRYLNTVIRQTSRQTIMEWINQSVVQEAKILLRHSDSLIYQISDKLNFTNPSFFCKFFKRMTGMTPQEYRKET